MQQGRCTTEWEEDDGAAIAAIVRTGLSLSCRSESAHPRADGATQSRPAGTQEAQESSEKKSHWETVTDATMTANYSEPKPAEARIARYRNERRRHYATPDGCGE